MPNPCATPRVRFRFADARSRALRPAMIAALALACAGGELSGAAPADPLPATNSPALPDSPASAPTSTSAPSAAASTTPTDDFTQLSLEELDALSISAASKRSQPLFETPAAVSVLLPSDLRRTGHASVAEALRLVPGVHVVSQIPGRWGVGIRGYNGHAASKLLVLVDGRTIYSPFTGSVDWGQADLPLDDLARIEVVRGPGAALWGVNAVNGIVNVASKDARDTQGALLSTRAGTGEATQAYVRQGGRLAPQSWYRVAVAHSDTAVAPGTFDDQDFQHRQTRLGLRADSEVGARWRLTTQGEHLATTFGYLSGDVSQTLTSALARLVGKEIAGGDVQLQLYGDIGRSRPAATVTQLFNQQEDLRNLDLDLTHHVRLGSWQDLTWGGGLRHTIHTIQARAPLYIAQPRREDWLVNFFLQDEIRLRPDFRATLGAKIEKHETIGTVVLPNLRFAWLPTPTHTVWTALSRSSAAPPRTLREGRVSLVLPLPALNGVPPGGPPGSPGGGPGGPSGPGAGGPAPLFRTELIGNPDFQDEINTAYEIGWRWHPHPRFHADLTGYYFDYSQARSLHSSTRFEAGPPPTIVQEIRLTNEGALIVRGGEGSLHWRVNDGWELGAGLSRTSTGVNQILSGASQPDPDHAVPEWLWHLRSWWQLPRDFEFSTTLYGVGETKLLRLAPYYRLDAQLTWRPRPDLEFSLGIQNANDPRHSESFDLDTQSSTDVWRNVYGRFQWRF